MIDKNPIKIPKRYSRITYRVGQNEEWQFQIINTACITGSVFLIWTPTESALNFLLIDIKYLQICYLRGVLEFQTYILQVGSINFFPGASPPLMVRGSIVEVKREIFSLFLETLVSKNFVKFF